MTRSPIAAFLGALLSLTPACAPRRQLCSLADDCRGGDCVAGQCLPHDSPIAYPGTRRLVLAPVELAVIARGSATAGDTLPRVFTLGSPDGRVEVLLRFDLHVDPGASIVRASILLDRSDAKPQDPPPVALHANRIIGPWSSRSVSWSTAPAEQDIRSPRTLVRPSSPTLVRVDVTDLARRWLTHDPADRGVALVVENETPTGATFALGSTSLPDDFPRTSSAEGMPPRLEVYIR